MNSPHFAIRRWLLALTTLCVLVLPLSADQFGDFTYTSDGSTITITGYTGAGGSITIPSTIISLPVRTIGNSAFYQTATLTSVSIPASVNGIGGNAFSRCTAITAFEVDAANPSYISIDGILFNKALTSLIQCPAAKSGTYAIPSSVTSIESSAFFSCTGITSVSIPASVASIGNFAFALCSGLTTVSIPADVTSIGGEAFVFCSGLTNALFNGNAPTMGPNVFYGTAAGFKIHYLTGKSDFTSPIWQGYPAVELPSNPAITIQPADQTVESGSTATFTVNTIGTEPLAYQWYQGTSGDTSTPVGTDSASFTTPALTANTSYWVRVTNASGTADSDTATARINLLTNGGFESPAIGGNLLSVFSPNSTTLTGWTVAAGDIEIIRPGIWSPSEGLQSLDLSGVSAATIYQDVSGLIPGATYRITFDLSGNPAKPSELIKQLRVTAAGQSTDFDFDVTSTDSANMGWVGREVTFVATAATERIQFQSLTAGDRGPALDNVSLVYDAPPTGTAPTITTQPASQTIASGSTATLTVTASGTEPLTYQWYQGTSGDTSTPVGTDSANFTTPALTTSTSYWVKVSNAANPAGVNSDTATVTVDYPIPVENFSFELPNLRGDNASADLAPWSIDAPPGWTAVGDDDTFTAVGVTDSTNSMYSNSNGPVLPATADGAQLGYMNLANGNFSNTFTYSGFSLGTFVQGATYKLTIALGGRRQGLLPSTFRIDLLANGTRVGSGTSATAVMDSFFDVTYSFTATAAEAGKPIGIQIFASNSSPTGNFQQANFDNVRLTTTAPGSSAEILAFGLPGNPAVINGGNISLAVPYGTNVSSLAPTFILAAGARCDTPSGAVRDFTTPQTYTVTSADALVTTAYTVTAVSGPTWIDDASGLWSTASNWSGGSVADGAGIAGDFSSIDLTSDRTVSLDSPRTIGHLTFGDTATASAAGWTVNNNGTATNILTLAGESPTITVNALGIGKDATISAQLTGTAGLTKTGPGTLTLTHANSYAGNTVIDDGVLRLGGASGSVGVGNIINNGTLAFNHSGASTLSNRVFGTGGLRQEGPGTVLLAGGKSFTGTTMVTGGTLAIANDTQLGIAPSLPVTGKIVLSGDGKLSISGSGTTLHANRGMTLSGSGGILAATGANNLIYRGLITGTGGLTLSMPGTGEGQFGNVGSDYSGGTTIAAGSKLVIFNNSTGSASTGNLTAGDFGRGTIVMNATSIRPTTAGPRTLGNAITLQGNLTMHTTPSGTSTSLTFNGPVTLTGATRSIANNANSAAALLTLSGAIGDEGNQLGLTFSSTPGRIVVLSGTNSYTGTTTVGSGILRLGSSSSLPAATDLVMDGGKLDLDGQSVTIKSLAVNGADVIIDFGSVISANTLQITDGALPGWAGNLLIHHFNPATDQLFFSSDVGGINGNAAQVVFADPIGLPAGNYTLIPGANGAALLSSTPLASPTITTQPASQTIASGSSATLTVTATGTEPITFQWYQGASGDTTTPVGTDSASFTTPILATTTSYWVKVSNAANPAGVNSDTATIAVSGIVVPNPLPPYDGSPGVANKPVKVYIMTGDAGMYGTGKVSGTVPGTLNTIVNQQNMFPYLIDGEGGWVTRNDVLVHAYETNGANLTKQPLSPTWRGDAIGPELGFGHVMGWYHDAPVLLIKATNGNRALGWDLLPPGSPRFDWTNGQTYPAYGESPDSWITGGFPSPASWYAGKEYDAFFLDEPDMGPALGWQNGYDYAINVYVSHNGSLYRSKAAHTSSASSEPGVGVDSETFWLVYSVNNAVDFLDNFATEYPQWAAQGFEIAGYVWWQGWRDGNTAAHTAKYEENMARFIKQLRQYYANRYPAQARPDAPFVLATLAINGLSQTGNYLQISNAQLAVDGETGNHPLFAGNVKTIEARGFWRSSAQSPANEPTNYNRNAETYMLAGDALGRGMVELLNVRRPIVATGSALSIADTTATLNGTVNPNGLVTTAQFEYGITTDYGSSAAVTLSPDNDTAVQDVAANLTDLQPGQTFHYRLMATNAMGATIGTDRTFATAASSAKDILTFVFPGLPATTITDSDISLTVPFATNVTSLAPTFTLSAGATCDRLSGTAYDFTSPVIYTVTAADLSTKAYTVTVTKNSLETVLVSNPSFEVPPLTSGSWGYNPAGTSWTFSQAGIANNGSPWFVPSAPDGSQGGFIQYTGSSISQTITFVDANVYTVSFSVVGRSGFGSMPLNVLIDGVPVMSLTADQISTSAWQSKISLPFAVTAGVHTLAFVNGTLDGDHANVIDNIVVAHASRAAIFNFDFGELGRATITGTDIKLTVSDGTDVTSLAPTFSLSPGAVCNRVSGSADDFTNPVVYSVIGSDLSTNDYTVTVTKNAVGLKGFTWASATNGNWSDAARWTNDQGTGTAPVTVGQADYTLNFNAPGTYTANNDLNAGFLLNRINFGGSAVTLAGNSLAFAADGASLPQLNQNSASKVTVGIPLNLAANLTIGGSGSGQLTFAGAISGSGAVVKVGPGTVSLDTANTFSGGMRIDQGTVILKGGGWYGGYSGGNGPIIVKPGATLVNWNVHSYGGGPGPTNELVLEQSRFLLKRGTYFGNITMTAGIIQEYPGSAPGTTESLAARWESGGSVLTTLPADVPSEIRYRWSLTPASLTAVADVADGPAETDLLISGVVTQVADGAGFTKRGAGTLRLTAVNDYTGTTTVNGGTLALANNAGLKFAVNNTGSNRLTGTGAVVLDGDFTIDTSAVTVTSGTWPLVAVATLTETFGATFTVNGFTPDGDGVSWSKHVGPQNWSFNETTGMLTLASESILTFDFGALGPASIAGTNISLYVPSGTNVTNLAPTFTLLPGATCDRVSGGTYDFTNPVIYTVTAEDQTSRAYTVTVITGGGLTVKTYDTTASPSYLSPIANLMAVTPSGTGLQTANLIVPSGAASTTYPGLVDSESYSLLWEGWFDVTKDGPGNYTFGTDSDDGSVIFLDLNNDGDFADPGEMIVDQSWFHSTGRLIYTSTVTLSMDAVRIAIGCYDQGGGDYMAARFKKGSGIAYGSLDPINGTSGHFFTARPPGDPAAANLWNFGLAGYPAVINGTTIAWNLPPGTDLASLAPTFGISAGATAVPASGTVANFTAPRTYTVTASDGSVRFYTVTARVSVSDGLTVNTFDSNYGTNYLNPITNLMALTPSGTGKVFGNVEVTRGNLVGVLPGLTGNDTFSVLWEGWFDASKNGPGTYTFGVESDDGAVIYLDLNGDGDFADAGELVVNNNRSGYPQIRTGEVTVSRDAVRIAIGYFENDLIQAMTARFKKGSGIGFWDLDPINGSTDQFFTTQPAANPAAANLWDFGLPGNPAVMSGTDIVLSVPNGTDVTQLAPTYTISALASCDKPSGSVQNFTTPQSYTVTSGDSLVTTTYTVTVLFNPSWVVDGSGLWSEASNWEDGFVAEGSGITADFTSVNLTADRTVTLDTARTVGRLIFGDADVGSAAGWLLSNNGNAANTLTLDGGTPTIRVNDMALGKDATIGVQITGNAGLIKSGTGTLTLTHANPYSGGTVIEEGMLRLGGPDGSLGVGNVSNFGELAFGVTGSLEFANSVSGSGSLRQEGSGTVVVSATNSYTGGTFINSGTLQMGVGGTSGFLGNGPIHIDSDATFKLLRSDNGLVMPNLLSGAGILSVAGTGVASQSGYVLSAVSPDFTGAALIDDSRLVITGSLNNAAIKVLDGGQIWFNAAADFSNPIEITGNGWSETSYGQLGAIRLSAGANASGPITLAGNSRIGVWGSNGAISGNITENGRGRTLELANLSTATNSTITVSGTNSHSGGTTIKGIVVTARSNQAFGTGPLTVVSNGTAARNTRLQLEGVVLDNDITLASTAQTFLLGALYASGGSLSVVNGDVTITSPVGNGGHLGAAKNTTSVLRLMGPILSPTETPSIRLGTVELGGGGNYSRLDVIDGTLRLVANNGVNSACILTLGTSGTSGDSGELDLNGYQQTLGGLLKGAQVARVVNNGASPSLLTLDTPSGSSQFSGVIGGGPGSISLSKAGPGTLTLTGSNIFTGGTSVNSGTLKVNAVNGLGSGPVMLNEGTLSVGVAQGLGASQAVTLLNTSNETSEAILEFPPNLTGTFEVVTLSSPVVIQSAAPGSKAILRYPGGTTGVSGQHTGPVTLQDHDVYLENTSRLINPRMYMFNGRISGTGNIRVRGGANPSTGIYETGPRIRIAGSGNDFTGDVHVETGMLQISDGAAGIKTVIPDSSDLILSPGTLVGVGGSETIGGLTGGAADPALALPAAIVRPAMTSASPTLTIGAFDASAVYHGQLSDEAATPTRTLSIIKTGAGMQTLSGTSSYTGITTIRGGVLSVGTINNGGVAGNLGAASSASNNLVLDGGTLRYTGFTAITNRGMTFNNAATNGIDVDAPEPVLTLGGVLTGSGGFTKGGPGTLAVLARNTFMGPVVVETGLLRTDTTGLGSPLQGTTVQNGAALEITTGNFTEPLTLHGDGLAGTGALVANAVSTLRGPLTLASDTRVGGSGTLTLAGMIDGAGALRKVGNGTLMVTGPLRHGGVTVVNSGTLILNSTLEEGGGGLSVVSILGGGGVSRRPVVVAAGALIIPGFEGIGALTAESLSFESLAVIQVVPGATRLHVSEPDGLQPGEGNGSIVLDLGPGPLVPGRHTLITYAGSIGGAGFDAFALGPIPEGYQAVLLPGTNSVDLEVVALSPVVFTGIAEDVGASRAVLKGTVNPNGYATVARFEYGLGTAYGSTAEVLLAPDDGTEPQEVSVVIEGLQTAAMHHYRLTATNTAGTGIGEDATFATETVFGDFAYTSAGGISTLTRYLGAGGVVLIPPTLNGLPVTRIGANAFAGQSGITAIVLPGTVAEIGERAFFECTGLTNVTIPASVTQIGDSAFEGCSSLSSALFIGDAPVMGVAVFDGAAPDFIITYYLGKAGFTSPAWLGYPSVGIEAPEASGNAHLAALILDQGALTPAFQPSVLSYSAQVASTVSSISITPFGADPDATVRVNGAIVANGAASGPLSLNTGLNLIEIEITAPDGTTTRNYTLAVTRAVQPSVNTLPAEVLDRWLVRLKGSAVPSGTVSVFFEYGQTTAYGSATPMQSLSGNTSQDFQADVGGLPPNAPFHFRAVATGASGTLYGEDDTFTTAVEPPVAATGTPSAVTNSSATLVGAVDPKGLPTTVRFEYGLTTLYGNTTPPQLVTTAGGIVDFLSPSGGLIPNATYHYRIIAMNAAGTSYGEDVTFEVKVGSGVVDPTPTGLPGVTTGAVAGVSTASAILQGSVNPNQGTTVVQFQYGLTPSYGQVTPVQGVGNGTTSAEVSIPTAGLEPGTTYHYRLIASNSAGTSFGQDSTFTTAAEPPVVFTGDSEVVDSTTVRVNGTVRAGSIPAEVFVDYGTDPYVFAFSVQASPANVSGATHEPVSAEPGELAQGTTYYYRVRAVGAGGLTAVGQTGSFQVALLSGLIQSFPAGVPAGDRAGSLRVEFDPSPTGAGWRFLGEKIWRGPGTAATGLTSGDRLIEYRPVAGHAQPPSETVTVTSGQPQVLLDRGYTPTGETGNGSLTVTLRPESITDESRDFDLLAKWAFYGETDGGGQPLWRSSEETVGGLMAGNHLIIAKPVEGRGTPQPVNVRVRNGEATTTTITYYIAEEETGAPPAVLDFETVSTNPSLPYAYVGQIRTDAGMGSGFVARPGVVATAGHVVFDDGTLASATGVQWLLQQDQGTHEPLPLAPRGYYVLTGYAAQRAEDDTPGTSTPASQNLDAAALYFTIEPGRGGFSGYLASDATSNEFLLSDALKTMVGYPVDGITPENLNRMHATPPLPVVFTKALDRTYTTGGIRGSGGASGGPLCVQHQNGIYYPAAIYLGGTRQMVVRSIDSDVAALVGFAELSAAASAGDSGGGLTGDDVTGVPTPELGALEVMIEPANARAEGAGWRIQASAPYLPSGERLDSLQPNSYTIQFASVPGFVTPTPQTVSIGAGLLRTVTFTYEAIVFPPVITSPEAVTGTRGQPLVHPLTASGSQAVFSVLGTLPAGLSFDPAGNTISGTPSEAGVFDVLVGASNSGGSYSKPLKITSLPVLANQTRTAPYLQILHYPIVSSESGDGLLFAAEQMPPGLELNPETGVLSGTPYVAGTFNVPIQLTRRGATASAVLTLNFTATAPVIGSTSPALQTIPYDGNGVLGVEATGLPAPSYQWYLGISGDTSQPVSGATSSVFATTPLTAETNFWVRVSSISGSTDSATFTISVLPSPNAYLAELSPGSGLFSPPFNPGIFNYSLRVAHASSAVSLTPVPEVDGATASVQGIITPSGVATAVALDVGTNPVTVEVTAADGITTQIYNLIIDRAPPATASTAATADAGDRSAILAGTVTPNGEATVFFEYGTTDSYGSVTPGIDVSGFDAIPVQTLVTGLEPDTLYHYRIVVSNTSGTINGGDLTFTTRPAPPLAATGNPVIDENSVTTLVGATNPSGRPTTVYFEYGPDTNYGQTTPPTIVPAGGNVADVLFNPPDLIAGNIYHYRLVAENDSGTAYGEDVTFQVTPTPGGGETSPPGIPTADILPAIDVTSATALLRASVNPERGTTFVRFEYGLTPACESATESKGVGNGDDDALVVIPVQGLLPGTLYHYRAVATNSLGSTTSTTSTFTTAALAPFAVTGDAVALGATSARITGTVRARGVPTDVFVEFGEDGQNFPSRVRTTPGVVSSVDPIEVMATLNDLPLGRGIFYRIAAERGGVVRNTGEVKFVQPDALVGLVQRFTQEVPVASRQGTLTVILNPPGIGGWRFKGERTWRASGASVTGLANGDRVIEFLPVAGYVQPPRETVGVVSGEAPVIVERDYYETPSAPDAGLRIVLEPASIANLSVPEGSRAQWRLAGESAWRDSGDEIPGMLPGNHLVECRAVPGYTAPPVTGVDIISGNITSFTLTYNSAGAPLLNPPAVVSFTTASTSRDLPYAYVGQFRTNSGNHSGFVVKPRVVATTSEAVFDDATLSIRTGMEWLLQRAAGTYEPRPLVPRGAHVFDGYASRRISEGTPGTLSIDSQNLNVAALYFSEDAGRGGFSGFLAGSQQPNEHLVSSSLKTLIGYPASGVSPSNLGRMHATGPSAAAFTLVSGKVHASGAIRGFGGMGGGPLCVRFQGGAYYPAAIYLGGGAQSLVRAIDADVVTMFNRAEISGTGGDNDTGGGITQSSFTDIGSTYDPGAIRVNIEPKAARDAGAGWRLKPETSYRTSGAQRNNLTPREYIVELRTASGFQEPAPQTVVIEGGKLADITFTYQPVGSAPTISALANTTINHGTSTGAIAFNIGDNDTDVSALYVTRSSSNTALVPDANIVLGGSGANRTVTVTPLADMIGTTSVNLTVHDGQFSSSRGFVVTVTGTALDAWRFANFGSSANTGTAADNFDADGDGQNNRAEFAAGTDPNNPADVFRVLTSTLTNGRFTVTAPGNAGRSYTLQRGTSPSGPWTDIATNGPVSDPRIVTLEDANAPGIKAFYRVMVTLH